MKINLGKVFDTGGSGGREPIVEAIAITENGTYAPSDGVDGFNPVSVDVQPPLQTKAVEITANGQSTIEADSGFYGLESVGLNVNVQPNLQTKSTSTTITSNGTSTITLEPDSNYDGLSSASVDVNVNVPIPTFETEELVATANGTYTPSTNGYSKVRVNVSEPVSKYVVPYGLRFGSSTVFNPDDFDITQITDLSEMFCGCKVRKLVLSSWDVSHITSMYRMFMDATDLESLDLSGWDLSNVTTMEMMFYNSGSFLWFTSLNLSGWDTSNVTSMNRMFGGCKINGSLDLSTWDVSRVAYMEMMFENCSMLTSINISRWNLSNVTSIRQMFYNCRKLTSLDIGGWDVSNVTSVFGLFGNCVKLTNLNINGWDMRSITNINSMFDYCEALTDLNMTNAILPKMDLTNWGLNYCPLTVDSLVSVLNALQQLNEGESYTCTIGSTNLAKLSDTEKSIATNKGWTLN